LSRSIPERHHLERGPVHDGPRERFAQSLVHRVAQSGVERRGSALGCAEEIVVEDQGGTHGGGIRMRIRACKGWSSGERYERRRPPPVQGSSSTWLSSP